VSGAPDPLAAALPEGVAGLFTTRHGGVSSPPWAELNLAGHVGDDPAAVAANRARLVDHLGGAEVIMVDQAHGSDVAVVDGPDFAAPGSGADALVSSRVGIALAILVADCLPVLLADAGRQIIGVAHVGRRGLAAGVLQHTVAAMVDLGARAADTVAVVGPGVCGACYQVPAAMRDSVAALVPGSASTTAAGAPSLDLSAGAVEILLGLGLSEVRPTGICTRADDRFYSYRRDGVTGRFAGVVMLADRD
jgi:hypothetical protein